ncbi:CGNR zinc finger domain-containing protein [Jiangella gansuensis]|uniref:CGNR zinc finger domain-containing protein n=1 Tax=Jiangella gansuensis TaxID=281473 RepID=UPI000478DDEB|nr:CGNR zinc finger domain-containing protein [Jiangella gansuensis]
MYVNFADYSRGAAVATDLVNTSPIVRAAGDAVADPAALGAFLAAHDIQRDTNGTELALMHALRDEVRAVLEADTEAEAVAGANALVEKAARGPVLRQDENRRWHWLVTTAPDAPLAHELAVLIGIGLLGTLRSLGFARFRPCASPACAGVFVDTSKAGRRRYCMPEVCGNRVNVANHRARIRQQYV